MTIAYSNTNRCKNPVNLGLCRQSIIKAANITNVIVDGIIANSEMGK
ncbi:MAG: hypothetical protein M3M86_07155 [Thermoproteota archaeon]|nr:hypothetical protein [Thermoproteota archaeon]